MGVAAASAVILTIDCNPFTPLRTIVPLRTSVPLRTTVSPPLPPTARAARMVLLLSFIFVGALAWALPVSRIRFPGHR